MSGTFNINKTLLTPKQLRNLTDERLNEYRKSFRKPLGFLKHLNDTNELTSDQHKKFVELNKHYNDEILVEMNKRKHLG
ncbi:hypothetical protein [Vibrio phage XZ1]|uniref:Uncharacterized protein n=2 Tax=Schizotequatrovirus valkk3 TaxID=1914021 RepID=A0A126HHA6_9CAUD|nr:hypothetical protein AVU32_gp328 [Vibrio phage ValKK3]AJT61169.1 hypothetical protein [Vibrio phage ValKK3]ALP47272.1 hypothetical protein phiGrn1_0378 [Vibrio phage phi-Grn1]UOL51215.1 hypothetical protein [Vibrio phage XZ1]